MYHPLQWYPQVHKVFYIVELVAVDIDVDNLLTFADDRTSVI